MNVADFLLGVVLVLASLNSLYLIRKFIWGWHPGDLQKSLALPLPLSWLDFTCYLAGFFLCYFKAPDWIILYALGSVLGLLLLRGYEPFVFWSLQIRRLPDYIKTGLRTYLSIFLPFALLTLGSAAVLTYLGLDDSHQPAVEALLQLNGFGPIASFLFFACVIAPLWEEITFRGFLYPFLKSKMGKNGALLLSALLFATMHLHLPSFVPLTFLGILLALLYERTGSLGYNILLHAFFNLSTCLFLLFLKYAASPEFLKSAL